jgi:iron complex transport system substrate-binding protein
VAATDDRGTTVRLAAPPKRVVSLAPSLTETVFFLGRGGLLVGDTRFCNRPAEAARLPKVGGVADPDPERILSLSPDLVLCTTDGNPREKVVAVEKAGVPVFCLSPQRLDDVYRSVERLGALLGDAGEGRRAAARLRRRAAAAVRAVPSKGPSPRVLFTVSSSPVIASGSGTFLDEIVRLSGGTNAAGSYAARYPRLSFEEVVALSPDVVFHAAMAGAEKLPPALLAWKEVPAFRDGAVRYLDGDVVTRPGPSIVDALEVVARTLGEWRRGHDPAAAKGKGRGPAAVPAGSPPSPGPGGEGGSR